MQESKTEVYVNGQLSPHGIKVPIQDGYNYKAVFVSKAYDESKDRDYLPEN